MNRIKELRQSKGLTQVEVAKKVGVSNQAIHYFETGKRKPKMETWQKLADYFEVPVPYLKGEIDREYLEKLVELSILISFPKIVLSYGYLEIDDGYKPLINIAIMSQILNEFNLDSKKKLQGIYKNVLSLFENDPKYVDYLKDFYDSVEEILPISKVITDKLIKAYENNLKGR